MVSYYRGRRATKNDVFRIEIGPLVLHWFYRSDFWMPTKIIQPLRLRIQTKVIYSWPNHRDVYTLLRLWLPTKKIGINFTDTKWYVYSSRPDPFGLNRDETNSWWQHRWIIESFCCNLQIANSISPKIRQNLHIFPLIKEISSSSSIARQLPERDLAF